MTFGSHEQDNDTANGKEPIEWLVLDYDEENNSALLISRYGLDTKPYNTVPGEITWEKCLLRAWLNDDFLNEAFTDDERAAILLTDVDDSKSQGYSGWSTDGGNNTEHKIFLLSCAEATRYFGVQIWEVHGSENNMDSRIVPTAYALSQGAGTLSGYTAADGKASGWWWLRSPGMVEISVCLVYFDGSLQDFSADLSYSSIRPAFWIDLEADLF